MGPDAKLEVLRELSSLRGAPLTQPTRQFVGLSILSILCTMHARHAEICDSCGHRVETFAQSWQLERRDRWSRAHPIESCMREGGD